MLIPVLFARAFKDIKIEKEVKWISKLERAHIFVYLTLESLSCICIKMVYRDRVFVRCINPLIFARGVNTQPNTIIFTPLLYKDILFLYAIETGCLSVFICLYDAVR